MKRRSFLRLLAGSSALASFPLIVRAQTLGLNGKIAPSNRLTIGLIGCGGQGNGIAGNALEDERVQLIAVCDVDGERRRKAKQRFSNHYAGKAGLDNTCSDHADFREITERKDIDAVLIATPDHWHALPAVYAARAGKHIYCEKPAAPTIPEGRAIVDAVERAGIVCQGGNMQRSSARFQRAVDLVRNGYLGQITRVEVGLPGGGGGDANDLKQEPVPADFDYDRWLGPAPAVPYHKRRCHWDWRWSFDYAAGQLGDWICHHYDIAALGLNVAQAQPVAVRNVTGELRTGNPLYNTATSYSFEVLYANGVVINVSNSFRGGVKFIGTEGWVWTDRGGTEYSTENLRTVLVPSYDVILDRGARNHMTNFVDCIGTKSLVRSPIAQMHNVTTVAHLANIALRSGRGDLRWNPATETLVGAPDAAAFLNRTYRHPWNLPA